MDLNKRIERAETEVGFCHAMGKLLGVTPELLQLETRAMAILTDAKRELAQGCRTDNDK